ncbi:polysaccharide deacetylase family protein [Microbacter margulisiae]|uniref:Peptidoglycan/xylan/chitin deacetylase (PgdA/CDA1 family) n=1 Tax=Microbacter margulisiae TaxID=1350067 RepID=A0A7W5H350_9PORP|nr:polysaccharide deacetylase family protein [Microbacter margulisiae]MBB3188450.1 peptidoglycan/xylan/chitin deacetylase (PgdA/CDA1 family) [Microbacter margulisiae]
MHLLLSFDIEEFDTPNEYGKSLSFEEQMIPSIQGTKQILALLTQKQIKATFFCTVRFAQYAPDLINEMVNAGHEVASHGISHSTFTLTDLADSKQALELITQHPVYGFRMARMMKIAPNEIEKAGYHYDSSLNPTFLPGRYNHYFQPRTIFRNENLWQIPASVTPYLRIPLFWLSLHNMPVKLYIKLLTKTLQHDGYAVIYFHPWEFVDLHQAKFGLPHYICTHSGDPFTSRLATVIDQAKTQNCVFMTFTEYIAKHQPIQ